MSRPRPAGELAAGRARRSRSDAISIDSRTLAPGDFFVAIRGERFDGHRFVADALARGAAGALVDTMPPDVAAAAARRRAGADSRRRHDAALQDVARDVRRRAGCTVVAITGSAGKTTTKEVAAELPRARATGCSGTRGI